MTRPYRSRNRQERKPQPPRDGLWGGWVDEPLNADQRKAESDILESIKRRRWHLLTGDAGAGKTFLIQQLALTLSRKGVKIVLTAPTHQAVAVLAKGLKLAGIEDVPCMTIQSLLSLRPKAAGDKLVFERAQHAPLITAKVIVCDECPMVSEDLMRNIDLHTPNSMVLFTGDPYQLNPVGERRSRSFDVPNHSHLTISQRQRGDNPLLVAARTLRQSQGKEADWSWVKAAAKKPYGVYVPSADNVDLALQRAFTSAEFKNDTDSYRYLAWTNQRASDINSKVRSWIYGDNIPTPLMPGEKALSRSPVKKDKDFLLSRNDEVTILSIAAAQIPITLGATQSLRSWRESIATWRTRVATSDGTKIDLDMVRDTVAYDRVLTRIQTEALRGGRRWEDVHAFRNQFAVLQSMYAMTVHSAQGSTVKYCFLDMPEMRRWAQFDLLESQRGAYVGLTRPTHAAILLNATV